MEGCKAYLKNIPCMDSSRAEAKIGSKAGYASGYSMRALQGHNFVGWAIKK